MSNKYIFSDETRRIRSRAGREIELHRIVAAKDFDVTILQPCTVYVGEKAHKEQKVRVMHIKAGELGGWIETKDNLSQEGPCWVGEHAVVFGKTKIRDRSFVGGKKTAISGEVVICDDAIVISDDNDKNPYHRTDVVGKIWIGGRSKITASLSGEGVVKNLLIDRPMVVERKRPKVKIPETRTPDTPEPSDIKISFECTIGDKNLKKQFAL